MRIAIVTGASSGMGREFVKKISQKMKNLDEIWVVARSAGKLMELEEEVSCKISVCPMDLTGREDMKAFCELLDKKKPDIRMLVNASGYGIHGRFEQADYDETLGMVELNCTALTAMTKICLPYIGKGGRIVQFASSAAFLPQPDFAVYAASKSFVLSFSRALDEELRGRKISVTAVCPGPVETAFFDRGHFDVNNTMYRRFTIAQPEDVVEQAVYDAIRRKNISVYGGLIRTFYAGAKLLPYKLFFFFMRFM